MIEREIGWEREKEGKAKTLPQEKKWQAHMLLETLNQSILSFRRSPSPSYLFVTSLLFLKRSQVSLVTWSTIVERKREKERGFFSFMDQFSSTSATKWRERMAKETRQERERKRRKKRAVHLQTCYLRQKTRWTPARQSELENTEERKKERNELRNEKRTKRRARKIAIYSFEKKCLLLLLVLLLNCRTVLIEKRLSYLSVIHLSLLSQLL